MNASPAVPAAKRLGDSRLRAWLVTAPLTMAVEMGVYGLAARQGSQDAGVLALLAATLWILLAAPVLAAGSGGLLNLLSRSGGVLDGSVMLLAVLIAQGTLGWGGAVKVYLIWLAISAAQVRLVALAKGWPRRFVLAMTSSALVLFFSAGPFWANGLLKLPAVWQGRLSWVMVAINPVLALARCLAHPGSFVWQERPILYGGTILGRDIPMPDVTWSQTVLLYGLAAMTLWGAAILRSGRGRAGPSAAPPSA